MNVKIIFFDVDGTLINYEDGCISSSTKKAIQMLKSNGIRLVAATGRPLSMCQELRELGIDTFITANGAYVKHKDRVIHKTSMTIDVVQTVKSFAHENKQSLLFFTEGLSMNRIQNSTTLQAMNETLSLHEFPAIIGEVVTQEIYLMCLYADDSTVEKYLQNFPDLIFKRWHPFIVNVLQQDVSKSIAIKKVLEYFNIKPSEAIAFGDGENDIDMLEQVGFGIAMGNAHETLKSVADFVTKKSYEDGIEFALQKLQLI
ncbi:Cof-type HAD-IIB family hydrolase [Rummeliibacillus sp. NPDC094406]|uniref:Cof-type HAD-IIB family hydrolase n=1 Tax=Rummeliibacillus sp. NPDC094406 TaxID=3364511 RepID=UPI00382B2708